MSHCSPGIVWAQVEGYSGSLAASTIQCRFALSTPFKQQVSDRCPVIQATRVIGLYNKCVHVRTSPVGPLSHHPAHQLSTGPISGRWRTLTFPRWHGMHMGLAYTVCTVVCVFIHYEL